jgi:hypothetical protein
MLERVGRAEPRVQRANVAAMKGVNQVLDIRQIHFDQRSRHLDLVHKRVQPLVKLARARRIDPRRGLGEINRLLDELGRLAADKLVGLQRDHH